MSEQGETPEVAVKTVGVWAMLVVNLMGVGGALVKQAVIWGILAGLGALASGWLLYQRRAEGSGD